MSPTTAPSTDQVAARLREVASAYAEMVELPAWPLTDAVVEARLDVALQALSSAQEMVARVVGEADAAGVAQRAGCSSTRAWLAARHAMSARSAAQALARARAMTPRTEQTRRAWAGGVIDGEQAETIAAAVNELSDDIADHRVQAAQRDLIGHAQTLTHAELRRAANRLVEAADPDRADQILGQRLALQEKKAYGQSVLRIRKGVDGVAAFSGKMPNLAADMLLANLEAIASPRRDHLRDKANADHLTAAAGQPDESHALIPYGNRLGQAFCALVEKIDARDVPSAGVNATLVVTVDEQTLRDGIGTACLSTGDDISAADARRLACSADIVPMVLGGESMPLDLGRADRLFDKSQRAALTVRDGGCVFPGCDRPPGRCEAHHVQWWSRGGNTDLDNAALLCWFHHRLIHADEGWQIQIATDGIPEIVPPDHIDPRRRPIRHQRRRGRAQPDSIAISSG